MSWIDSVVKQHEEFESPLNFWRWAAMAAISAVVKDNVYLDFKVFNVYPNIYVMFHADSGLKKGPPVNLAKRLVTLVGNTRVISGRSSIQGILKELSTEEKKPGQELLKKAVAFICSSELSSSIVSDPVATTILTDLYDRSYNVGEWRSLLKMERFDLVDPTITMLTATNEAHSSSFFEAKDVAGGYFARTFIIHEKDENRVNSLLVPPETQIDYPKMALYLKQLAQLKGEFEPLGSRFQSERYKFRLGDNQYYTEAGAVYEEWYRNFKVITKGIVDPTGTLNRFGASVLKIAMILALAEEPNLDISASAMEEAISQCEKLVGNIRKVTVGKTDQTATDAGRKKVVITELLNREGNAISRAQLHKKYWPLGTIAEWDETMLSMEAAGFINMQQTGSQLIYEMRPDTLKELKEYFEGKGHKGGV